MKSCVGQLGAEVLNSQLRERRQMSLSVTLASSLLLSAPGLRHHKWSLKSTVPLARPCAADCVFCLECMHLTLGDQLREGRGHLRISGFESSKECVVRYSNLIVLFKFSKKLREANRHYKKICVKLIRRTCAGCRRNGGRTSSRAQTAKPVSLLLHARTMK